MTHDGGTRPTDAADGRRVRIEGPLRCLAGAALLVAGAAMLVLPGPGVAALLAGLALLAPHVPWAARAIAWLRGPAAAGRRAAAR